MPNTLELFQLLELCQGIFVESSNRQMEFTHLLSIFLVHAYAIEHNVYLVFFYIFLYIPFQVILCSFWFFVYLWRAIYLSLLTFMDNVNRSINEYFFLKIEILFVWSADGFYHKKPVDFIMFLVSLPTLIPSISFIELVSLFLLLKFVQNTKFGHRMLTNIYLYLPTNDEKKISLCGTEFSIAVVNLLLLIFFFSVDATNLIWIYKKKQK